MILRRISEHVRAQNWFAVGLDFLIVVLGVFVATQVAKAPLVDHHRKRNGRESGDEPPLFNATSQKIDDPLPLNLSRLVVLASHGVRNHNEQDHRNNRQDDHGLNQAKAALPLARFHSSQFHIRPLKCAHQDCEGCRANSIHIEKSLTALEIRPK